MNKLAIILATFSVATAFPSRHYVVNPDLIRDEKTVPTDKENNALG